METKALKIFKIVWMIAISAAVIYALIMGDLSGFNNTYLG